MIDKIKSDATVLSNMFLTKHNNLPPNEREALQSLKNRDDIIIKPADKGSAVVVMDKSDYLEEAERQLSDTRFYKKLTSDPTPKFSQLITK